MAKDKLTMTNLKWPIDKVAMTNDYEKWPMKCSWPMICVMSSFTLEPKLASFFFLLHLLIWTAFGGEANCSLNIWFPSHKIIFHGTCCRYKYPVLYKSFYLPVVEMILHIYRTYTVYRTDYRYKCQYIVPSTGTSSRVRGDFLWFFLNLNRRVPGTSSGTRFTILLFPLPVRQAIWYWSFIIFQIFA